VEGREKWQGKFTIMFAFNSPQRSRAPQHRPLSRSSFSFPSPQSPPVTPHSQSLPVTPPCLEHAHRPVMFCLSSFGSKV
jgi:hypothetical protein